MPAVRLLLPSVVAVLSLGLARAATAQTAGAARATAVVLSAVTVTGSNLDFGSIAATGTKTVAPTAGTAGQFTLNGPEATAVTFTITTLPANFGPPTLTLSAWQGRQGAKKVAPAGTAFTPVQGYSTSFAFDKSGLYNIWLGATVTASGAPGGSYSVPIVISVAYN